MKYLAIVLMLMCGAANGQLILSNGQWSGDTELVFPGFTVPALAYSPGTLTINVDEMKVDGLTKRTALEIDNAMAATLHMHFVTAEINRDQFIAIPTNSAGITQTYHDGNSATVADNYAAMNVHIAPWVLGTVVKMQDGSTVTRVFNMGAQIVQAGYQNGVSFRQWTDAVTAMRAQNNVSGIRDGIPEPMVPNSDTIFIADLSGIATHNFTGVFEAFPFIGWQVFMQFGGYQCDNIVCIAD